MKIGLVKTLVCPTCASGFKIKIKKKRKNDIEEGQLICTKCGKLLFNSIVEYLNIII